MAPLLLLVSGFFLLFGACESSSKNAEEPVQPPRAAASRPEAPPPPKPSTPSAALIDVSTQEMYVGQVTANERLSVMAPSEYCLDDGVLYQGSAYRLGKLNVFGIDSVLASMKGGAPIAVSATKKSSLFSRIKELGPCPDNYEPIQMQMRSDWIPPEQGPNTTRALLESLDYLEASSAQPVHMFEALDSDDKSVRVRIRNPFTLSLADLKFTTHYEGGPGKPMPTYLDENLALAPGEWAELELPRRLEGEQERTKMGSDLRSIELHGQLGKATLAIELFVAHE